MTRADPGREPERPGPAPRGQRIRPLQGEQGGHAAGHLLPEDDGGHDFPGSLAVAQDEAGEGLPPGDAFSLAAMEGQPARRMAGGDDRRALGPEGQDVQLEHVRSQGQDLLDL